MRARESEKGFQGSALTTERERERERERKRGRERERG